MPQLEVVNFASQIFWLVITFVVFYLIMSRAALPTVREVLHNRQTRIAEDLKRAEKLKEEAESTEADFTSAIVEARQKSVSLVNDAREKQEKDAMERNAKLDETFAHQAVEAERRIEEMKKDSLDKLMPVASEFAYDIATKIVGLDIVKGDAEKEVAKFSKEEAV